MTNTTPNPPQGATVLDSLFDKDIPQEIVDLAKLATDMEPDTRTIEQWANDLTKDIWKADD